MISRKRLQDQQAEVFLTPQGLADRWHTNVDSLANTRSRGQGIPFFKTPTGKILYAMTDILEAEIHGKSGLKVQRVIETIMSTPACDKRTLEAVARYVKLTLDN